MSVDAEKTVGQLVAENPSVARVLEKAGIDYCCGGKRSLAHACDQANVPLRPLLELLEEAAKERVPTEHDWTKKPLSTLVTHIVNTHHAYVRQELPRLQSLAAKVKKVHGNSHSELESIADAFDAVAEEMTGHMMKEERILFPYIVDMESAAEGRGERPVAMFGTVENPIRVMLLEHDSAGREMRTIRELSSGYTIPADACASYRTLYEALAAFESDLFLHVHLENNILFPRALELERS